MRPAPAVKKAPGTRAARTAAAPVAGPSKPAPPKKNGRKAQKDVVEVVDEPEKDVTVIEDTGEDSEEPEVEVVPKQEPAPKSKGKAPQSRAARQPAKTATKVKAVARSAEPDEAMEVDVVDSPEDEPPAQRTTARNARTNKTSKVHPPNSASNTRDVEGVLQKEIDRLRKLEEVISSVL